MSDKVIVTAALLYANGPMHFGHLAGAYLASDCYARFERLQGSDVLYVTGSDEYGVAITLSAEKAGRTPQDHVDLYHKLNNDLFDKLNFSFDKYARTTWEGHAATVNAYFEQLLAHGYIEKKETEQLYSEADNRFLADRYVIGQCPKCHFEKARGDECTKCGASFEATDLIKPRSQMTGAPLKLKKTTHWFLMLDKLANQVKEWMADKEWKPNVLNFCAPYLEDLRPRAITRDGDWGVPVPLDEATGKVFYVWFEACIGYLSASKEWAIDQRQPDKWKEYWCDPNTRLVQFVGKDNIFFHAIFFPAMTLGQNEPYKTVDDLPANEFLNLEGKQFSKSDNWTVDLKDFLTRYSADQIRYTLAANAPENSDSEFTWADFHTRCNSELVGKFGNLANRTLVFAQKSAEGKIPPSTPQDTDTQFLTQIQALAEEARQAYAAYKLRRVCQLIMEIAAAGNTYFDHKKPWVAAKDPATHTDMQTTIACCLECLKILAVVSSPIIPESAQKLWALIGLTSPLSNWDQALATPLTPNTPLSPPQVLFAKIPDEQIAEEVAKLKGAS